ncbi:MAG: hypothetical protein ACK2U1_16345 [Anaerolineales bacterium]
MTGKRIWKIVFALVIVAGLVLGGVAIYQAGFAHGAMTNFNLSEGSEYPSMPFGYMPYERIIRPRVGLLGIFPLLCFGGFFFLLLFSGFGFFARRRVWMHTDPCAYPNHWKHHGPPPWWGQGKPPEAAGQSQKDSNAAQQESEDRQAD